MKKRKLRIKGFKQAAGLKGRWQIVHERNGVEIGRYDVPNGITDAGMNKLLDVMFHGVSALPTWYAGLINNAGFSALAGADTMASHAGWVETHSTYDETDRVEWTEGSAAARSITNSSPMVFTMNTTITVYGIFVTSDNTKGGTSGTLWSTAAFASPIACVDDDVLRLTYTVNG